ncbi:MAG: hypothetical protein M3137_11005 [Actinomycetota bacterium]|nr:hypothetical protein [Actinomycetota bacterium]
MSDDLRSRAMQVLLDQVASAKYPSVSMMNRVEESVTDRETAHRYVELLLEALERDAYPSPTMLDRVLHLVEVLEKQG